MAAKTFPDTKPDLTEGIKALQGDNNVSTSSSILRLRLTLVLFQYGAY
jgi:hypothetical protein